ncbi:MAG: hypothetical protein LBL07_03310 [Tannerella sp.]|jgi:hypothetical protein|nr:hypothetical protein [Tannerella sp.]
MRKIIVLLCCTVICHHHSNAQKKNFDYSFYGFVRGDLYYNSRDNIEAVDGLFYLFPKDKLSDANGKDLNGNPDGSFYTFTTRLGLNIKGPAIGAAKTSANIESDFGGTTDINFMLRLRQAYIKLDWQKGSSLLLGQAWHPLFGEVMPNILNLSTGAPFQPFSRSPQIKYQYAKKDITLTTSAIYQLIYTSVGPAGKSEKYLKDGILPELYAGADYKKGNFLIGAGVDMISLKPRLETVWEDRIYRVNERVTSFSYDFHAKYTGEKLQLSGKTVLASNQTHNAMIGGFGVTKIDDRTGEQEYTPFRHSTSWLNLVYGRKYQGGLFAGYTKNLGTSKSLISADQLYGSGLNMDQFANLSFSLRYVLAHVNIGVGYTLATAWYGETDLSNGKSVHTHTVSNHRFESIFMYLF